MPTPTTSKTTPTPKNPARDADAPAAAELHDAHAVDPLLLELLIDEHRDASLPRFQRLWEYYRNHIEDPTAGDTRWYSLAQEQGLPGRITGQSGGERIGPRHEVVIENDIAWRVHSLVDFMFGKPLVLQSCCADPQRATLIENFLRLVLENNGGVGFLQDVALLGSVYGFGDLLLRVHGPDGPADDVRQLAQRFTIDVIEAPRAIPVLCPDDYRRLDAYVLHYHRQLNSVEPEPLLARRRGHALGSHGGLRRASVETVEVWTAQSVCRYEGPAGARVLVEQSINRFGRVPVVHIQNLPQPFFYEGLSEIEPLIPLQDELNTRLSDRANRVTFQSFKMYLGRGIDGFLERPVGPGQMWASDNLDASIQEFGGDGTSPSEEAHINEIREAMDKTSSVSAVAAGVIRNKLGNLTSESALRVVLMGLLAKTEKKRVTYGSGIERLCELVLHAADITGALPNAPHERGVRLDWASPLPEDTAERLREAQLKLNLGVPRRQVLTELGYGECDEAT